MLKKIVLIFLFVASNGLLAANINGHMVNYLGTNTWLIQGGSGKPPIILLSGAGEPATAWQGVLPELSKLSSVFAYDRAGVGKTESRKNLLAVITAKSVVHRLRGLLELSHVQPPYVLVSSGLGSSYARYFARNFPSEISAMVLINPDVNAAIALGEIKSYTSGQGADQVKFRELYRYNQFNARHNLMEYVKSVGKFNVTDHQASIITKRLEQLGAVRSEQQIIASPPLKSIPVIIMEGKQDSSLETSMIKQLIANNPQGKYQFTAFNSDELQKFSPEIIVAAVKQVLR